MAEEGHHRGANCGHDGRGSSPDKVKLCFTCAVPHCVFYDPNHRGLGAEIECDKHFHVRRCAVDTCEFYEERSDDRVDSD